MKEEYYTLPATIEKFYPAARLSGCTAIRRLDEVSGNCVLMDVYSGDRYMSYVRVPMSVFAYLLPVNNQYAEELMSKTLVPYIRTQQEYEYQDGTPLSCTLVPFDNYRMLYQISVMGDPLTVESLTDFIDGFKDQLRANIHSFNIPEHIDWVGMSPEAQAALYPPVESEGEIE